MIPNGYKVSFAGDESVLELDSCDGCMTLQLCEHTKNQQIVHLYKVDFYSILISY